MALIKTEAAHPDTTIAAYLDDTYALDEPLQAYACMRSNGVISGALEKRRNQIGITDIGRIGPPHSISLW